MFHWPYAFNALRVIFDEDDEAWELSSAAGHDSGRRSKSIVGSGKR